MQREETTMTEQARDFLEKNVTLPNGLKIHYESRGVRTAFTFDRHFRQYGRFEVLGLAP